MSLFGRSHPCLGSGLERNGHEPRSTEIAVWTQVVDVSQSAGADCVRNSGGRFIITTNQVQKNINNGTCRGCNLTQIHALSSMPESCSAAWRWGTTDMSWIRGRNRSIRVFHTGGNGRREILHATCHSGTLTGRRRPDFDAAQLHGLEEARDRCVRHSAYTTRTTQQTKICDRGSRTTSGSEAVAVGHNNVGPKLGGVTLSRKSSRHKCRSTTIGILASLHLRMLIDSF